MTLALFTAAIVLLVLLWELIRPRLRLAWLRHRARAASAAWRTVELDYDPGRERRAEQRARTLLASCIDEEDWAMYRDLGFLRVWGAPAPAAGRTDGGAAGGDEAGHDGAGHDGAGADVAGPDEAGAEDDGAVPRAGAAGTTGARRSAPARYAYLIYPHKPIVAYMPQTGTLLNEYCVAFPDHSRPYGSARLPDSDDVLAKWMALKGDERRVIADANMHLPGRQVDPDRVRRDLGRLARWERERAGERVDSVQAA